MDASFWTLIKALDWSAVLSTLIKAVDLSEAL